MGEGVFITFCFISFSSLPNDDHLSCLFHSFLLTMASSTNKSSSLHSQNAEARELRDAGPGDIVCRFMMDISSRGIWFGDDPLAHTLPLILAQLSTVSILTRFLYVLLKPFGQPSIVSQILGGIILGPSVLGGSTFAQKIFPPEGRDALETLSIFGFMLFVFQIGVKINPLIVFKVSKLPLAVGLLSFCIPFALASCVTVLFCQILQMDENSCSALQLVVKLQALSAFPAIAIFLADLNILNSDVGRLASSSSMICDVCYWSIVFLSGLINMATTNPVSSLLCFVLSLGLLTMFIVYGIRRAALWAIRDIPEGKPVKDIYVVLALVAVMACGFVSEAIGLNVLISSFLVGLVIPDGPPLGAAIVERLDCFMSVLLMPIFFALCGLKTDVYSINSWDDVGIIQLAILVAVLGKVAGTMIPPLLFRMPFKDSVSLALIMNSKGFMELIILNFWLEWEVINDECFAIMIVSMVVLTGVISALVKAIYDPSRRFTAYKRRTIRHLPRYEELRILACVHTQDNIRSVITLLHASNPTKENPIRVVILHLTRLAGSASPQLTPHMPRDQAPRFLTESERIFNTFQKLEQRNSNHITVHCYKGISPFSTMHNDVCALALEQRTTFIIIPFHKQPIDKGRLDTFNGYRNLNKNVLEKAPCSVGVLIDNGSTKHSQYITKEYRILVLFFGGADDREALVYAQRMSEHHHVVLTVLRFSSKTNPADIAGGTERSKMLNSEMLDEFISTAKRNEHIQYREETVASGTCVLGIVGALDDSYDLVMVGRRHGDSQLMAELGRSVKQRDLGVVAEMIAIKCTKLRASVLVVQQQKKLWGLKDPEESTRLRRVGFCLGPTVWGDTNPIINVLFPLRGYQIGQTVAFFGLLLFLFVIGAKMDMSMVTRAGKKAVAIGILISTVPLGVNLAVAHMMKNYWTLEPKLKSSLYTIAYLQSISTYYVIVCVLADLKLLNSELGPVAASASMISGALSYLMAVFCFTFRQSQLGSPEGFLWMLSSVGFIFFIIIVGVRPIFFWMIRNSSEDKPLKESYVISIFIMLMISALCSEALGQHLIFGGVILGAALPSGPPLGSAVVYKLETFSSILILPSYFVYTIAGVNIFKLVDMQTFSIMAFAIAVLSGIYTPVIKLLYNPSKQFSATSRRTIEHASPHAEFRMFICIYNDECTPSMISLLEVSNPTSKSPICCYVVHLMELAGRLSPVLVYHRPGKRSSNRTHHSNHIINAFRLYERHSNGHVMINLFTAIAPLATIDDEVCRLALKKRTSLLVIPFHRQWRLHGLEEFSERRPINRNILNKAPCSVGILIDRGTLGGAKSRTFSLYNIGVIFLGGMDDREALAYALRMASHPNVGVTLIHVTNPESSQRFDTDWELDKEMVQEFRVHYSGTKTHHYRNEVVKDTVDMVRVIKCLENTFELLIVGKDHDHVSPALEIRDWSEFPELGFIGDMLASTDACCEVSVLVVQQHRFGYEEEEDGQLSNAKETLGTVEILCHNNKVFPEVIKDAPGGYAYSK
ncbi:hypothetical protein Tsubulata_035790 [Turnera subulata]|uniref:Cation/H+ exchanger domain-containing protein n=1 Tax=Turnera subulata TaxID=218843 RepID=A0A9Q0J7G2_9ROSI|nr:hypothetical protein Tsubulata_035790 [Turnera subulata]